MRVGEIDQRTQEVVPLADEGQNRDGGQRGAQFRQDDRPENAKRAGAVHFGCFVQVVRDASDKLAQQEDEERRAEERGHDLRQELEQVVVSEREPPLPQWKTLMKSAYCGISMTAYGIMVVAMMK